MKVIQTSQTPNGTRIQVEDWRGDYDIMPDDELIISAYPIFAPIERVKSRIRCNFVFKRKDIGSVFYNLREGRSELRHYVGNLIQAHRDKGYGQYL